MSKYLANHITKNLIETMNYIKKDFENQKSIKVLDLGCGNKPYESLVINYLKSVKYIGIDYYNENADIRLDLNKDKLPFKDNEIDLIICTEVLEHLYNPFHCIKEMKRVLKSGGFIFLSTPFFAPIHDKKHDYFRFTENFYLRTFNEKEGFKILKISRSNSYLGVFPLLLGYYLGSKATNFWKYLITFSNKLSNIILKDKFLNKAHYYDLVLLVKKVK